MTKQQYLGIAIGSVMIVLFAYFDFSQPLGVAGGVPYLIPVMVGLFMQNRLLMIIFGLIGIALTIIGFYISPLGSDLAVVLMNRGLAIFAIASLTLIGYLLIKKQVALESNLLAIANTDALTGVSARRVIMEEIESRVPEAHRYNLPLSVLIMDIDHFKQINDRYGHLKGDKVLKLISQKCKAAIRSTDFLGRYGGEEFLILCPNTPGLGAMVLAERIRATIENLPELEADFYESLTVSIGVASLDKKMSAEQLVHFADRALYAAKKGGRNKAIFYEEELHKKTLEF